jgi:hypothetical protein
MLRSACGREPGKGTCRSEPTNTIILGCEAGVRDPEGGARAGGSRMSRAFLQRAARAQRMTVASGGRGELFLNASRDIRVECGSVQ